MDTKELVTQDPFSMMERLDEQQVLDEIKGRAIDTLVYEIRQNGQTVTGLSLSGVREVARMMNTNNRSKIGITDKEPIVIETDDYIEVRVYAQDVMNGGGYWGIKRQTKKYLDRNGDEKPNLFAYEQALAKAQRNALRGLIPEWYAREMINTFRGNKMRVIDANTDRPQSKQNPAPAQTADAERATAKRSVIKTSQWQSAMKEVGTLPYYQKNGGIDTWHILGSAVKLGYAEITDENVNEVVAMLKEHARAATESQALPQEQAK